MGEELIETPETEKDGSTLGAFLGMVMSGVLSMLIAFAMFMIGVIHEDRAAERELKGLVHFMAVESTDVYGEACDRANSVFINSRYREMNSPTIVSAENFGRAMSLEADPLLAATLRSVYGSREEVRTDLHVAYEFYKKKRKSTQTQLRTVRKNCQAMGKDVQNILTMAAEVGVDEDSLKQLRDKCAEAERLTGLLENKEPELLPDLLMSRKVIDLEDYYGEESTRISVTNYASVPVLIKDRICTLDGVKFDKLKRAVRAKTTKGDMAWFDFELEEGELPLIKPDESLNFWIRFPNVKGMKPGELNEVITIKTDFPGYEELKVQVKGTKFHVVLRKISDRSMRSDRTYSSSTYITNWSTRPVTIKSVSSTLRGLTVDIPEDKRLLKVSTKNSTHNTRVNLKYDTSGMKVGTYEGAVTIETDCPGQEKIVQPVKIKVYE